MSKTQADLKTEPEKVEVKRCPLSGISCAECGYEDERYRCFLLALINALQEVDAG